MVLYLIKGTYRKQTKTTYTKEDHCQAVSLQLVVVKLQQVPGTDSSFFTLGTNARSEVTRPLT